MSDFVVLLIEFVRQHHLWFLGSLLILQNNGLPLGSNLVVMASGALAFYGEFSLPVLGVFAWFFSLLGDTLSYWLWHSINKYVLHRFPRLDQSITTGLKRAEKYHTRYGKMTVVTTRFPLSALGTVINVFAGISGYSFMMFFVMAALGELLWVSFYLGLGYLFGDSWEQLALVISQSGWLLVIILALVLAGYIARRICLKKSNNVNHNSSS